MPNVLSTRFEKKQTEQNQTQCMDPWWGQKIFYSYLWVFKKSPPLLILVKTDIRTIQIHGRFQTSIFKENGSLKNKKRWQNRKYPS
jgi:hypothetical protein